MKLIPLTQGKYAIVDDWNYDKLIKEKWHVCKDRNTHYAKRNDCKDGKQKTIRMHRIIMNAPAGVFIDHINGNGFDCREANLRIATVSQNNANRKKRIGYTSQFLGVHFNKNTNKWIAQISHNKKREQLGYYEEEETAAIAYDLRALELHGEFANLNFK